MKTALEITVLARLIETGVIKKGARTAPLIKRLSTARWISPTPRRNQWAIRETARSAIEDRLGALLPTWRKDLAFLKHIDQSPYDPSNIEALPGLQRPFRTLPTYLNRRNWNAAVGLGPKHRPKRSASTMLTKDWILRFRPNEGLMLMLGPREVPCSDLTALLGECIIPERSWKRVDHFFGILPCLVISCENLGAYIDFPVHKELLVVWSPGDDWEPTVSLLNHFADIPWMHFGDLDPKGVAIAERLARLTKRPLNLYIPAFAADYLPVARAPRVAWPQHLPHPLLQHLRDRHTALFQESLMLDERLARDVESLAADYLSRDDSVRRLSDSSGSAQDTSH